MLKPIWDGAGYPDELREVFFTKHNGVPIGRRYLRNRVRKYLVAYWSYVRPEFRAERVAETLANTVDKDEWLRPLNCQLVTAVARAAKDWWLWNGEAGIG